MRTSHHPFLARSRIIGALCLGVIAALACTRPDSVSPDDLMASALSSVLRGKVLPVDDVSSSAWASDPLTVGEVSIDGDTLRAQVTYGGGCRRHALQPIAGTTWAESWPVQIDMRIAHNAARDPCRSVVTRVLHIDLSPLRDLYRETYHATAGRIAIRLAGAADVSLYEFR